MTIGELMLYVPERRQKVVPEGAKCTTIGRSSLGATSWPVQLASAGEEWHAATTANANSGRTRTRTATRRLTLTAVGELPVAPVPLTGGVRRRF